MSEFLKLAYELISQVIYNVSEWAVNFIKGFIKVFVTGWVEYKAIIESYFGSMDIVGKILTILLVILLIAIPVVLIILIIRSIILNAKLRADGDDNVVLYREIGRLNKQVLQLMDEKNQIMKLKLGPEAQRAASQYAGYAGLGGDPVAVGAGQAVPVSVSGGAAAEYDPSDPFAEASTVQGVPQAGVGVPVSSTVAGGTDGTMTEGAVTAGGGTAAGAPVAGGVVAGGVVGGSLGLEPNSLSAAAATFATAAAQAKEKANEELEANVVRFPKLDLVDQKYRNYEEPEYNTTISLPDFAEGYRKFACSQLHLYYTPEIIRRFIGGMAASHILILEGISGTGKTSLPYSFSRYIGNPATIVSVQPSYRDRSELLGYFNEFSKKFNETEFLRALYEAGYRKEPTLIVLDEMNLARIEYYFAEMLSVLEMPDPDEWIVDLVPVAWPGDPERMDGGKIKVSTHTWFIGTANSDDSTFTITDKVYDRAMPIELNQRAEKFECELEPRCCITTEHLFELFDQAKEDHPISDETLAKMTKMDNYLQTRFKLAFGNRIMKQMYEFIPVYVACGGTELGGLDYILARKVLKKFESMNVSFVRDEIKNLIVYMDKIFGEGNMPDCIDYLNRIQNMY